MAKYKLTESGVVDTETNAHIPNAPGNRHWDEYQVWLGEGNTPDPADAPPAPPTNDELYDATVDTNPVLKALLEALDAGDLTPGGGRAQGLTAIKSAVVARMP